MENKKNKINIIVPFYNCKQFLEGCISSIMTQNYENFHVYFVDDFSSDGSWDILPHGDKRVTCIRNEVNKTALPNIHDVTMKYCEPDSVVCLVDGDDKLLRKNSLSIINDLYNEHDCLLLYGQSIWSDGRKGIAKPYSEEEFKIKRKLPFYVSHIRTYRAKLYLAIEKQDPLFSCLKDKNGNFYRCTYDVAIIYPMLDMCSFDKVFYNDIPLYLYCRDNPISDDKVRQQLQWDIHQEVLRKPPLKQIENF